MTRLVDHRRSAFLRRLVAGAEGQFSPAPTETLAKPFEGGGGGELPSYFVIQLPLYDVPIFVYYLGDGME